MAEQTGGTQNHRRRTPRARSGVHHFVASEQLAIQFALRHLVPGIRRRPSGWEEPIWCGFTWFTSIRSSKIRTLKVEPTEQCDVSIVERDVTFRLANDPVVIITMWGQQPVPTSDYPNPSISWTISRVQYATRWEAGDEGQWVDCPQVIGWTTWVSPILAPIG